MGLGDLLGGMGGMGGLGMLGGLGGLGGLSGLGGGGAAPPSVVIYQPAMLIHNGSLYIAYKGKITKFDASTLVKQQEAYFDTPAAAALQPVESGGGLKVLDPAPGMPKPPLVPGAVPSTGP